MIRKRYAAFVAIFMLISFVFLIMGALHFNWRAGYTTRGRIVPKIDLPAYYLDNITGHLRTFFTATRPGGLPKVDLFIGEARRIALMDDLPDNIKLWQPAMLVYPNGKLRPVKVHHRGDNPMNWIGVKKSWAVKTRKKQMLGRTRRFNLLVPQEVDNYSDFLAYSLGQQLGVLAPNVRLVELYVNGEPHGIYTEVEHLDENFLRNNKLMPVNIYKGERNVQSIAFTNNFLFDNPYLFEINAKFNGLSNDDRFDLNYFLNLLRRAGNDDAAYQELKRIARFSDWARFLSFTALLQSWHNTQHHNQRLVGDPWRGVIQPIAHNILANITDENAKNPRVDDSQGGVTNLYIRDSRFLALQQNILYDWLVSGEFSKQANKLEALLPNLAKVYARDSNAEAHRHIVEKAHISGSPNTQRTLWNKLIHNMRTLEVSLKKKLAQAPDITWSSSENRIALVVDGVAGAKKLKITLKENSPVPTALYWDKDADSSISAGDVRLSFRAENNELHLDETFFANRTFQCTTLTCSISIQEQVRITPTIFRLIASEAIVVQSVVAKNHLSEVAITAVKNIRWGASPGRYNHPVPIDEVGTTIEWSGTVVVDKTMIIDHSVIIHPGTVIRIAPGASLIFRQQLFANGTENAPIKVMRDDPLRPWGTLALQGNGTRNSEISHLQASGGSGAQSGMVLYTGMISIHDTSQIRISNVHLSNNSGYDDLLHIVYGKGIILENIKITGAIGDSIDIDLSEVAIENVVVEDSGNDALDLMTSNVSVRNSVFIGSGDKGISAGEASRLFVTQALFKNNNIGIEAKDSTVTTVANSVFIRNVKHLNSYKKNWRYGGGGHIVANSSVFLGVANDLNADKYSKIEIHNSIINPDITNPGKRVILNNDSRGRSLNSLSGQYSAASLAELRKLSFHGELNIRREN
jgi:hypothetical protein